MVWDGLAGPWLDPACVQRWLNRPDSPRESGLYIAPRNTRDTQQLSARTIRMDHPDGMAGGMAEPWWIRPVYKGPLHRPDSLGNQACTKALWIYRDPWQQPARPSGWMVWLDGWWHGCEQEWLEQACIPRDTGLYTVALGPIQGLGQRDMTTTIGSSHIQDHTSG